MATAKQAKIQFEAGASLVAYEALTDSGDATIFNPSNPVMSGATAPVIRPNGIVTGFNLLSENASADTVSVAAFTANSEGTVHSVSAGSVAITRPASDVSKVISITMTDAGALAAVAGTDGSDTSFSATRGAAGGPPYIPADSVEIGQVRVTASASAVIADSEIYQNGQYTERADFPTYDTNNIGGGSNASASAKVNAYVEFSEALELSHTGDTPKGVYAQYYVPSFADLARTSDFVPAEISHSLSSEEHYGGSISSSSESLGQASFKALLTDGVTDGLITKKGTNLTIKVFPDRAKSAYLLTQGLMAVGRQFPIGTQINATVTISPEQQSAEFSS